MIKVHNKLRKSKILETGFLFAILVLPVLQFIIFYLVVNFNSILLAFQKYEGGAFVLSGFGNFRAFISDLGHDANMIKRIINTLVQYGVSTLIIFPLSIIISYAIWRGVPLSGAFKIIIFLPQIISPIVFVILLNIGIEELIPTVFKNDAALDFLRRDKAFYFVVGFGAWLALAGQMVLYLGAMSNINPSLIEYGKIEGITPIKEFFYVVVPCIWNTIVTFLLVGVAGFFTNYGQFYNIYGNAATENMQTIGYYFFVIVIKKAAEINYPYAAAAGIVFTIVACVITLTAKYLLEKYGPSEETRV